MPSERKAKAGRGVPRKAGNARRHQRIANYWAHATCFQCSLVFRSPSRKRLHEKHGHVLTIGKNPIGIKKRLAEKQSTL